MCDEMRRLLAYADVVTPNVTEACELLSLPYRSDRDLGEADLLAMAQALAEKGPQGVILTGIHAGPASVVRGESLEQAVQKASDFICRVMAYTETLDLPHNAGLAFEEYLTTLR